MKSKIIKAVVSILIFIPIWIVINFIFGYNSFMGAGVFAGRDLILWQNILLNISTILVYVVYVAVIVWRKKMIAGLIIIIMITLMGYGGFCLIKSYYGEFSTEKWQNHKESRYLMAGKMLKKYHLEGMTFEEIEKLLGETEKKSLLFGNYEYKDIYVYTVRDKSWLVSKEIEYLILYFDDKGKVWRFERRVYRD